MDTSRLQHVSDYSWRIEPHGNMRVAGVIYADEALIRDMDDKVYEQICNVTMLPGIVGPCYAMPDAHWGYGFPIGGVAAFDPDEGGVISAGGVGFDISCGVRALCTGLSQSDIESVKGRLADALYHQIPVGLGSTGKIHLDNKEMDQMLRGGAQWAIEKGYGHAGDLDRIEEHGRMQGADPAQVSMHAKERQRKEMGTLGSGNHYLEVQEIAVIYDADTARIFGLRQGQVIVSIHCGSRGLGHQIGTEYLRDMAITAGNFGIKLPDRELACAPINSPVGQNYLGAMRSAVNCALANRQIITHLTRNVFAQFLPEARLDLLYDVSHNTCKVEQHTVKGEQRKLFVHRKGATRAFGPGHPDLPDSFQDTGQPVLIGGSMGTESYVMAGNSSAAGLSYASACHGAGRAMSRRRAFKQWNGRQIIDDLASKGILIRSPSSRGIAEEAPGAYKDVAAVVDAAHNAGLARKVVKLKPLICIKG